MLHNPQILPPKNSSVNANIFPGKYPLYDSLDNLVGFQSVPVAEEHVAIIAHGYLV